MQQRLQQQTTYSSGPISRKNGISSIGGEVHSSQHGVLENEAIKAFKVNVVQQDGKLGEPMMLSYALANRKKDSSGKYMELLRQVQQPDADVTFPICRYYNIQEERAKELARKKRAREIKGSKQSKRIELNWTIGDNDLGHRMEKLREFLREGKKVEVLVGGSRKRGWQKKKADSLQTALDLVSKIKAAALEVDGTREGWEMRGNIGQQVELCFEAPSKKEPSTSS